jgi:hypothetical protein
MSMLSSIVASPIATAQSSQRDAAFVAAAKQAAAKYRTQAAAVADGFRPVGVEFPAMGEHWVSLQRVMANTIDPALPSVLIYVTVDGRPTLGGVGYTDLLRPGESLPQTPAPNFWHEHNGSVTEESFPLRHQMGQEPKADNGEAIRLAILHLWTEIPNDAGVFVADNWRLPLRRLGTAARLSSSALHAIALAQDETGYYALMLRAGVRPTDRDELIIDRVLADARASAIKQTAALRASSSKRRPASADDDSLATVWENLWRALGDRLPSRRTQLSVLRTELESGSRAAGQMR